MSTSADSGQRGRTRSADMTYSLRACACALLSPRQFFQVDKIRERPSIVPAEPGIYGWWFSNELPGVPVEGTLPQGEWRLLYVGIAPSGPTSARRPRTLRSRLKNHCRGPAATSTLRRTLACLLQSKLRLQLRRNEIGKLLVIPEHALTEWMNSHARVVWVLCEEPWRFERKLIKKGWPPKAGWPRLPLNISGSLDPFCSTLRTLRTFAGAE
jgi:GIY-YIG catalytic domain-containing protein